MNRATLLTCLTAVLIVTATLLLSGIGNPAPYTFLDTLRLALPQSQRPALFKVIQQSPSFRWTNLTDERVWKNWSTDTEFAVFSNISIPHEFGFVVDIPNLCASEQVSVLNVVITASQHRPQRDRLRKEFPVPPTWRRVFVTGYPVKFATYLTKCPDRTTCQVDRAALADLLKESLENEDLIILEHFDIYQNLTLKTIAMLRWAISRCAKAKYLLKTDDDLFPNFPALHRIFTCYEQRNQTAAQWLGTKMTYPALRTGSRNIATYEEFPGVHYPYYASGTRYAMSMDVVHAMSAMTERVPLLPIEDVYIGICGHLAGLWLENNGFKESGGGVCGKGFIDAIHQKSNETVEEWKRCGRQPMSPLKKKTNLTRSL